MQPLLDAVVDYLPSPLDVPPVTGDQPADRTRRTTREVDPNEPVLGARLQDRQRPVRRQAGLHPRLLRQADDRLLRATTATKDQRERIGRLLQMHANHREDISEVSAGDIAAIIGLKATRSPATRSATRTTRSSWSRSTSPSRSSSVASSRRRAATRTRWASRWRAWPRKTRPSACGRTRRPARRSSPAWASCTWT